MNLNADDDDGLNRDKFPIFTFIFILFEFFSCYAWPLIFDLMLVINPDYFNSYIFVA